MFYTYPLVVFLGKYTMDLISTKLLYRFPFLLDTLENLSDKIMNDSLSVDLVHASVLLLFHYIYTIYVTVQPLQSYVAAAVNGRRSCAFFYYKSTFGCVIVDTEPFYKLIFTYP